MKMYKIGHSVEVIPHMKALISVFLESEAQGRASSFILCHALMKIALLIGLIKRRDSSRSKIVQVVV